MAEREPGPYLVRCEIPHFTSDRDGWEVWHWCHQPGVGMAWALPGRAGPVFDDDALVWIGPRIEPPEDAP